MSKLYMRDQSCKNCIFAMKMKKDTTYEYTGICRRFPPVIYDRKEIQPKIKEDMWCGEYKYFASE